MFNEPLLAGLDVGTTNIKALIFTPDGQVVSQASQPTPTHVPQPGWAYYEPEELWQTVASALHQATSTVDAHRITSVAVASMGEAGVPLDSHNKPLYPAIAWFDPRTIPQAEWLEQHIGKDPLFSVTGLSLQPIWGLCKLLWLKQNEPDIFSRAVRWLHIADYIAFRLCGTQATDYSLASRTLALDLAKREWSTDILKAAGIEHNLYAPLCVSGTALGNVILEAAQVTGLPITAQVAAGGHDHLCGALAAGVTTPGVMLNSLGTAETIVMSLDQPLTDPKLGREGFTLGAHVVEGLYYIKGSLYTSGACVEWFRSVLGEHHEYADLISEAEAVPTGSQGVCFLPHFHLASPPYDDHNARGAFIGLSTGVSRGTLFRAVLEGTAYDSRLMTEAMLAYEGISELKTLIAVGGVTRNALWMRIRASVLNRSLMVTDISEAASLGAALLGGLGANIYKQADDALVSLKRNTHTVEPHTPDVPLYDQIYTQVYKRLYPALSPLHQTLHSLPHL